MREVRCHEHGVALGSRVGLVGLFEVRGCRVTVELLIFGEDGCLVSWGCRRLTCKLPLQPKERIPQEILSAFPIGFEAATKLMREFVSSVEKLFVDLWSMGGGGRCTGVLIVG